MPTYEYACEACGHQFERFQSITAKPVRVCPSCGKRRVKRLLGAGAALIFKGSGFYATDYRSESYRADAKKAKDTSGGNGDGAAKKKGEGKADAKPSEAASASGGGKAKGD